MPTYDYRCEMTGEVFEVKHSMSEKLTNWGELCQLKGIDPGAIPLESEVTKLLTTGGVVSSKVLKNPVPPCGGGGCGSCSFS